MKMTREEYKDKFMRLWKQHWNYIPQENELIIQIEECDYLFYSNMGYMYSVFGRDIKTLKPSPCGKRGTKKDGTPKRRDWEWKMSGGKHLKMTTMAMKYFSNVFEHEEYIGEPYENHHIHCNGGDMSKAPQQINKASELERVPRSIHNKMTQEQSKTYDEVLNEQVPEDAAHYQFIGKGSDLLEHIECASPYVMMFTYDKDTNKCTEAIVEHIAMEDAIALTEKMQVKSIEIGFNEKDCLQVKDYLFVSTNNRKFMEERKKLLIEIAKQNPPLHKDIRKNFFEYNGNTIFYKKIK